MNAAETIQDLVLVGGGHAHVFVLKAFGMRPMAGVRITLISRDVLTPYSGMLPGFIAGHYSYEECHIDLEPLARFAGARLFHDEVVGLDLAAKRVLCANRPPVPYDLLSLDVGSRPRTDVPGSAAHAVPVKPIDGFAARWKNVEERVLGASGPVRIGVVGGGAGGVELALAAQFRLRALLRGRGKDPARVRLHLVAAEGILRTHAARAQRIFARVLSERGVEVHRGTVVAVEPGRILYQETGAPADSRRSLDLEEILWVTQAGAAPWLRASGLACDENGFVRVLDTLRSETDSAVFAAGDMAAVTGHPRPKAGVFAVRQGPPLAENLRLVLDGGTPAPFHPQKRFLSLISTGDRYAVASRGRLALEGAWLWRYKNRLDRLFMEKFSRLPSMDAPPPEQGEAAASGMRCGGCGAKVGSTVLSRVLARLGTPAARADIAVGLDAPDDAAVLRIPPGKVLVQTVDFFRAIVDDPYLFGKIAANHCLGDVYAMGAEPSTALATAVVPYGREARVEDDLFQMMSGAKRVLDDAGVALVGGHTGEGAELALGFSVNGLADESALLRKKGLVPGQALILTKAIGTGAVFAAAMRRKASGRQVEAAVASMVQSSRDAAACLIRHGATACTDVTGFGLAGHLLEMLSASSAAAEVDLTAIPLLDGAREASLAGIASTLYPENARSARAISSARGTGMSAHADAPRLALLFDPQTAGGLLAGIPSGRAAACVAELRSLGYASAAAIGSVLPAGAFPERVRLRA